MMVIVKSVHSQFLLLLYLLLLIVDRQQPASLCVCGAETPQTICFHFLSMAFQLNEFQFCHHQHTLALCLCFFQCFRLSSGLFIVSLFVYFSLHFIILKASIFELVQIKKQISPFCRRARCNYLRQNGMITTNEIKNNETQCIITLIIIIG